MISKGNTSAHCPFLHEDFIEYHSELYYGFKSSVSEPKILALTTKQMITNGKVCEGSRVAQRAKALHLSARGVTTDPGLIPGCITTGYDWESHWAVHNLLGFGRGRPSL